MKATKKILLSKTFWESVDMLAPIALSACDIILTPVEVAAQSGNVSEMIGVLVVVLIPFCNFWLNYFKNRREENLCKKVELKEMETRLDNKIRELDLRIEKKRSVR
jgi:hypothetical protein